MAKCSKCGTELEAIPYLKSKENKKRYVKFVCPKCKSEVYTDIPAETIEASLDE